MFSTFWPPQPSSPGQSRSRWKPLLVDRSRPLALGRCSSPGATSERFTSAALALQAIVNCKRPVCSPQPSSMTPLQLSSIALKQSSGPVGVHACASDTPAGPARFDAVTSVAGGWAPGGGARGGAHDTKATKAEGNEARRITPGTLPPTATSAEEKSRQDAKTPAEGFFSDQSHSSG